MNLYFDDMTPEQKRIFQLPKAGELRAKDIQNVDKVEFRCSSASAFVSFSSGEYSVQHSNGDIGSYKTLTAFKKATVAKESELIEVEIAQEAVELQENVYKQGVIIGVTFLDEDGLGFSGRQYNYITYTFRPRDTIFEILTPFGQQAACLTWSPHQVATNRDLKNLDEHVVRTWSAGEVKDHEASVRSHFEAEDAKKWQGNTKTVYTLHDAKVADLKNGAKFVSNEKFEHSGDSVEASMIMVDGLIQLTVNGETTNHKTKKSAMEIYQAIRLPMFDRDSDAEMKAWEEEDAKFHAAYEATVSPELKELSLGETLALVDEVADAMNENKDIDVIDRAKEIKKSDSAYKATFVIEDKPKKLNFFSRLFSFISK